LKPEIREVLRCLGAGTDAPEDLYRRVAEVGDALETRVRPRWTWRMIPLDETCPLDLNGQLARTMLAQCHRAVVLCCTLGMEFDALLRAEQARDLSRAVIVDAWGSVWVEHGCDEAEKEIAARFPGEFLTDRFSPGYGDLPLSMQREICTLLDLERRLGVHRGESDLLTPWKTVTAIIGLSDQPQMARIRGCEVCSMRETCSLRKGGTRCGL